MGLKRVIIQNFTAFEDVEIEFSRGINVIVGPNGTGKTHLLKILYAAAQATDAKTSFSQKLVRCFLPDDYRIARLVKRQQGSNNAKITVTSYEENLFLLNDDGSVTEPSISMSFSGKTPKWDAKIKGEDRWEWQITQYTSNFIPAKEILSNAYNLNAAVEKNNVLFDDTYLDIINSAKVDISVGKNSREKEKLLGRIEKIIGGKVSYDAKKDEFYLRQGNKNLEFPLVAEGIRKVALLWQLVKNGTLEQGAILFWDEPEANINPVYVPILVDLLLELEKNGVQIFISTHDYFFSKYVDVRKKERNEVSFLSLYQTENGVKCECGESFDELEHNSIMDTFLALYREEVGKAMS